ALIVHTADRLAKGYLARSVGTCLDVGQPCRYGNSFLVFPRVLFLARRVPSMKRAGWLFGVLTCASLVGRVERRVVIEAGAARAGTRVSAQVLRNGQIVGFSPVDDSFVYYGKYRFTLIKDGYQPLHVEQPVRPPWWEIPPLDFISENIIPFKLRDIRRFSYP